MATRRPKDKDVSLPFAALQLLAPPVRLVSAALWKVLKQRDVMQYGVVEEFVTSACETVPGLLTTRHQAKLALGLRARYILELCSTQPDVEVIRPHLDRIRAPVAPSSSSTYAQKKDLKVVSAVQHFHTLVQTLLTDAAERKQFFKEEFQVEYGPKFDQELEKLLWEFLIRLDQLLPVPNLGQTVSWLADAPPVLEECAQAATQPQLLEIILQHQTCLGHLEIAASLPPNMGDSILASLSLPPSGRVASKPQSFANQSNSSLTQSKTPFISPVFGLISNQDVPIMTAARTKMLGDDTPASSKDSTKTSRNFTSVKEKPDNKLREEEDQANRGMKRKHQSGSESSEEEEEVRGQKKSPTRLEQSHSKEKTSEIPDVQTTRQPEEPHINSIHALCLKNQPRVVIEKLSMASGGTSGPIMGRTSHKEPRTKSPRKSATCYQSPESPGLDDKENLPVVQSVSGSSSQQRTTPGTRNNSGDGDDYVADSEDEATKNFKGRLFTKRYYKTRHGTYVPTLREYCKPGMMSCNFLSTGIRHRR